MRERGGNVVAVPIETTDQKRVQQVIERNVEAGSILHNHSAEEWVRGDVYINGIESVWALLKRGIIGTFHHVSRKHLARYVDEFAFRLNEGSCQRHTMRRIDSMIARALGKRITYATLTAK